MIQRTDITALVMAAGYSSRMEQFKPLLPLGPMTAVEWCIRLFRSAGIPDVRVVVGYRATELQPTLDQLSVRTIINDRFAEGMFSSVKAGVKDLESSTRAFFLLPVDIPLIRRTTVQDLVAAFDSNPEGVCIPSFLGRRGHPPIISTQWSPYLVSWNGDGGLRAFLSRRSCRPSEVPVADEHILMDMDTPEDYRARSAATTHYDIPSAEECLVLLTETFRVQGRIVAHSSKVAQVALHLTRALNGRGCSLDAKLIVAAALLHDLAKGRPDHAAVAAAALTERGYSAVAEVVASHMDTKPRPDKPISPLEVVCFADKMVMGDTIVPIETRFRKRLVTFRNDPRSADKVAQRFSNALRVRQRLEKALGSSVESVLSWGLSNRGDGRREALSL